MYNLNVNVNPSPTGTAGLLGVTAAAAEVTPRTPEIVNSLIAMTNPFEGYGSGNEKGMRDRTDSTSSGEPSPPSVQHTCSQLIKEGLKLTLQTKRRANSSGDDGKKKTKKEDGSGADDEEEDEASNNNNKNGASFQHLIEISRPQHLKIFKTCFSHLKLTPEDEERRRRRRERNKIAATKCRLKKREKTVILVQESEILETQNLDLKSQIQELETQRRRLVDMLSLHGPTCLKQGVDTTSYQQFAEPLQLPSYQDNFVQQQQQPPPALNQPQNCVTDYPVKVEEYETDFYRQSSPFVPTTSDAGCTV
ncbi:activating transcription factor 3 isoform X1 [Pogonomyrmex barbatus]|uniref:Activating transcription factor 3 isoform X1 n=1 Tax=Pogonomyrmex barbatus TaxID=144034 RepID=A0A6I9VQE9_9HYME|nr:activating transcription factor 3 isoform X1 [Pogonomyrmex barbatus]XP_011630989.1 activating transcription factor 3 isoform X1 [Pogonomyrmex barbatus]